MYEERNRCYELLGLAPGASAEELKAAHRDLVKVWHPDRFAHDPRLQQKAQEKLKEINEAYEMLTTGRAPRHPPAAPQGGRREAPAPHARRARWPSLLLALAVFGAVAFVALRVLGTRGAGPSAATERPRREAAGERPTREEPASVQQTQARKRPEREAADTPASGAEATTRAEAAAVRALPTVTLLIDPTTGLLATPACPVRSRTTYAAGQEPARQCDAHRKGASNRAP